MAHLRKRFLNSIIAKRLKLWPVVGLIGPRQSGKSVILRDMLSKDLGAQYVTLDSKTERERALHSPESFASRSPNHPLIIDEVQKAPELFDAVKQQVDSKRIPGKFILSGSTEFSKFTGIREALTGRMGILRLYPLTTQELFEKKHTSIWLTPHSTTASLSLLQFDKRLEKGGMPGMCFLRSSAEFDQSAQSWIETSVFRDLLQLKTKLLNPEIAMDILEWVAKLERPNLAEISHKLKKDARVVRRHLDALKQILVLHELEPNEAGVGKSEFVMMDSGLAAYLGAPQENLIRTFLLHEMLAHLEFEGVGHPKIQYWRNEKTSRVGIVFSTRGKKSVTTAVHFVDQESVGTRELAALEAFSRRFKSSSRLLLFSQTSQSYIEKLKDCTVEIYPLRA